jgi:sigma54-dependent transcription regulator
MFNTNDIYARLANGEKIEDIGNEIAAMMNEAVAKHDAEVRAAEEAKRAEAAAQAEKEAAKRGLIEELVEIVQELAILEGMDPDEIQVTEEDMDQMVAAFTEMFAAMRDLKKLFASIDTDKVVARIPKMHKATINVKPSDDQILADFIKMFN